MNIKGKNKYGLKLEDFDSYKDYRKAYINLSQKDYYNTEEGKSRLDKYRNSESYQLVRKKAMSKYRKGNGKKVKLANCIKRKSAKLKRTPKWANLKEITNFYKGCPKGLQVDHIIPLQGDNISGLHVLNNLQFLTPSENASKGNKWTSIN